MKTNNRNEGLTSSSSDDDELVSNANLPENSHPKDTIPEEDNDLDDDLWNEDDDLDDDNLDDVLDDGTGTSSHKKKSANDAAQTSGSRTKKSSRFNVIRRIILIIAVLVFCYSAYMLLSIYLEYKKGDDIYNNIQEQVLDDTPTTVAIPDGSTVNVPFKYDHAALLSINPEGVGFMYIPSINIQLPIVQSTDNDFYLTHTFDKTANKSGCLFEDYRITGGLSSSNVIIYGHDMKNGSMFGQLNKYEDYSFWNTAGNDTFYIYTENKVMQYRIFSVYISEPVSFTYTFNFSALSAMHSYADTVKNASMYDTGIDVSNASQVVTLSTCTGNGEQRLIVHGIFTGETSLDN